MQNTNNPQWESLENRLHTALDEFELAHHLVWGLALSLKAMPQGHPSEMALIGEMKKHCKTLDKKYRGAIRALYDSKAYFESQQSAPGRFVYSDHAAHQ